MCQHGLVHRAIVTRVAQCKNCQSTLNGQYCSTCGQRDMNLERPIWGLVRDLGAEIFEVDGRIARTLQTLFRHPGMLTTEFLAGRRRTYTSPLRLYLAVSISFFIMVAWLAQAGILLEPGQDPSFDAAVQARFLSDDLPRLMFALLPVFALLMKIVYRDRLYFDHLIFSLHLHSAAYLIYALQLPLGTFAGHNAILLIVQAALLGSLLAHFVFAVRRVYQSSWPGVLSKSAVVLFGYMILVSLVIENTSSFRIIAD